MNPAEIKLAEAIKLGEAAVADSQRLMEAYAAVRQAAAAVSIFQGIQRAPGIPPIKNLSEHAEALTANKEIHQLSVAGLTVDGIQQSPAAAKFLAREAEASIDGWAWRVRIMECGFAVGTILSNASGETCKLPQYYPPEIVAQVAKSANGARFRRKHPQYGDGADLPELTAGFVWDARMEGSAALGTVNLFYSGRDLRSMLLAAEEAGMLDLFGVSIFAYFVFEKSQVEGIPVMVAKRLDKFVGLDLVAEPGGGGRFLQDAAPRRGAGESGERVKK